MLVNLIVDAEEPVRLVVRNRRHRQLDALIDWYEQHKPGQVNEIPVGVHRSTVMSWGIKPTLRGAPIMYRGKLLKTKSKLTPERG